MMNWLMNIKQKDITFLSKPFSGEIDEPPTINEEKKFDFFITFAILYAVFKLSVSRNGINLVLNTFTFHKFLHQSMITERILSDESASGSRAQKITTEI